MSNVEKANTPIPAFATGTVSAASTPTSVNGIEPATRRQRQPFSLITPSGTAGSAQTTDNSSPVRVTEDNPPEIAAKAIESARRAATLEPVDPGVDAHEVADEAALLAAYAALGTSAPTGEIELQGELASPSAKALRRDGGRPSGFTAP